MDNQTNETYLNHPTFGLLYRICLLSEERELYTTLYAQRLFFIVTLETNRLSFNSISRSEARLSVENRLRTLRATGLLTEYQELQDIYQRTFH